MCNSCSLTKHLRLVHGLYDGQNLQLCCGQGTCARTFNSFSAYKRHLERQHVACLGEHHVGNGPVLQKNENVVEGNDGEILSSEDEEEDQAEMH